jgi:hypothetical protein
MLQKLKRRAGKTIPHGTKRIVPSLKSVKSREWSDRAQQWRQGVGLGCCDFGSQFGSAQKMPQPQHYGFHFSGSQSSRSQSSIRRYPLKYINGMHDQDPNISKPVALRYVRHPVKHRRLQLERPAPAGSFYTRASTSSASNRVPSSTGSASAESAAC